MNFSKSGKKDVLYFGIAAQKIAPQLPKHTGSADWHVISNLHLQAAMPELSISGKLQSLKLL